MLLFGYCIRDPEEDFPFLYKVEAFGGKTYRVGGMFGWKKGLPVITFHSEGPSGEPLDAEPPDQIIEFVRDHIANTEIELPEEETKNQ